MSSPSSPRAEGERSEKPAIAVFAFRRPDLLRLTLDSLEKALTDRDSLMVFLKVEPKWDNLRSEPRFIELMRKMNFN